MLHTYLLTYQAHKMLSHLKISFLGPFPLDFLSLSRPKNHYLILINLYCLWSDSNLLFGEFWLTSWLEIDFFCISSLSIFLPTSGTGSWIQSTSMPLISIFRVSFRYVHLPILIRLRIILYSEFSVWISMFKLIRFLQYGTISN